MMDNRLKHIDIRYDFIIQALSGKNIKLIKIDGKLNLANALTKVIPIEIFRLHCTTIQVLHGEHR